jgi:hypothetical protein
MRWVERVARKEEMRNIYKIFAEHQKGRDHSEDLWADEKTISKWITGK